MYLKLAVLIYFLLPFVGGAQECNNSLSGQIRDFHDRSPLAGATIIITGQDKATISDPEGLYSFKGLCDGTYEFEISHPECRTTFVTFQIKDTAKRDFLLEHHLEELEEVQVTGDIISNKTLSAQEKTIGYEALEQYSSESLGDALKEIGGISSLNTGSNIVKPSIHGLSGSRILVLNKGVRMQDMEWGDEHAPNIDINSADHISVVKGATALQYAGDAIGGVVIIEKARIPARDTLFGKTLMHFMSNGRGSSVSTELTKAYKSGWYLRGQASIKKLGDREAPGYILSNTGAEELGLSLNAGMRRFDKGLELDYSFYHANIAILRASHIGNVDDLIQSINTGQPSVVEPFTYSIDRPRQEITHHLGKISYYKRFTGLGKWSLQYDFQNNRRFEYDIRVGADRNKPSIDLELSTHSLNTDFIWDASRQYKAQLGFTGRFQDNFANPDTGVRRLIPDYRKYDFGAFLTGEYRIFDGIMIEAGLRYDLNRMDARKFYQLSRWEERGYEAEFSEFIVEELGTQLLTNPVFNYHNISASAGLLVAKNNSSEFRANYVRSQRAPNPSELFSDGLHHSAARIELGDLRIGNETSHKIALAYTKKKAKWGYSLEPYVNFISDFILTEPSGLEFTLRGAFPVWNYRQTNAKLLGIDASAYLHWAENWESNHNLSLVKGTDADRKTALIDMPAPILKSSVSFLKREWNNFEISLISTYLWKQNEYPPNIEVFSPVEQQQVILDINSPPGAYHLLGLRSGMEFSLGGSMRLSTGLKVDNLLNTNYRDYLNRQRYYADDLGRNIVLQLKFNY